MGNYLSRWCSKNHITIKNVHHLFENPFTSSQISRELDLFFKHCKRFPLSFEKLATKKSSDNSGRRMTYTSLPLYHPLEATVLSLPTAYVSSPVYLYREFSHVQR